MKIRIAGVVSLVQFIIAAGAMAQIPTASCSFQPLDYPGAQSTEAAGINNAGVVVGSYFLQEPPRSGFIYHNGQFVSYTAPASTATSLAGINSAGTIVGSYQDQAFKSHGFVLRNRQLERIDFPRAASTQVSGINDGGVMVGSFSDAVGATHGFVKVGGNFVTLDYPGANYTALTAISGSGAITGVFLSASDSGGFLYSNGHFSRVSMPGAGGSTNPFGINIGGEIVGRYSEPSVLPHVPRGFLDRGGAFKSVIFGADHGTVLKGVNNVGAIVGQYHDKSPEDTEFRSFIATNCK